MPFPRRWSIRRWLGSLALAVGLPLLVLLVALFVSQVRSDQSAARDEALRIARATAARMRDLHTDSLDLLERMAARPQIRELDPAACGAILEAADFDPQDENLFLFDPTGRILCAGTPHKLDPALSASTGRWIAEELRAGRLVPRMPVMRAVGNSWISVTSIPVSDSRGVPRAVIALMQVSEIVGKDTLPPNSTVTILDDRGTIVARSNHPELWNGRNVRDTTLGALALRQPEGRTDAVGLDGVSREYGFTYLPDVRWHIYAGIPTADVMRPVRRFLIEGLAGGVVIVALVTIIAMTLARRIARPINALARAADSLAAGKQATVSTTEGPREIALLAETFNEMVTTRLRSEHLIRESEGNLKMMSERLLAIEEEERIRIARELHDDLGQSLTALKMDVIGFLNAHEATPASAPVRDRIVRTLDATVTAVQRISAELRPPLLDDLGLIAAVESEARLFEERSGIECETSLPAEDELRVDEKTATTMYRIIQEALTNVSRHSDATRVELRVRRRGDELLLEIRDDGHGLTGAEIADPSSFGLIGMRERAAILGGSVHFEGVPGRGTIVSVRIPSPLAGSGT